MFSEKSRVVGTWDREGKTEKVDVKQNPTIDNLQFCREDWREVITSQTNPSGVRELRYLYSHTHQSLVKGRAYVYEFPGAVCSLCMQQKLSSCSLRAAF